MSEILQGFRQVPFEGSEAQKVMHDISKGIITNDSKDPMNIPGYSPWGDYDFNAYHKEEEHNG